MDKDLIPLESVVVFNEQNFFFRIVVIFLGVDYYGTIWLVQT